MNPPVLKRVIRRSVVEAQAREVYQRVLAQCEEPDRRLRLRNRDVGKPPVRRSIITRALLLSETEDESTSSKEPTPAKNDKLESASNSKPNTISTSTPHFSKSRNFVQQNFSIVISPISLEKNATSKQNIHSKVHIPETKSRTSKVEESKNNEDIASGDVLSKKPTKIPIRTKSQEKQLAYGRSQSVSRKSGDSKQDVKKRVSLNMSAPNISEIITISSSVDTSKLSKSENLNTTGRSRGRPLIRSDGVVEVSQLGKVLNKNKDSQIMVERDKKYDTKETMIKKGNTLQVHLVNEEIDPATEKFYSEDESHKEVVQKCTVKDTLSHSSVGKEQSIEEKEDVPADKTRKTIKVAEQQQLPVQKHSEIDTQSVEKSRTITKDIDTCTAYKTKKNKIKPVKKPTKKKKTTAAAQVPDASAETQNEVIEIQKTKKPQCDAGTSPIHIVTENSLKETNNSLGKSLPKTPKTPGSAILKIADRLACLTSHKHVQTSINKSSSGCAHLLTSPRKHKNVQNMSTQTVADRGAQTSFETSNKTGAASVSQRNNNPNSVSQRFNRDVEGISSSSVSSADTSVLFSKPLEIQNLFQTLREDYVFPPNFSDSECEVAVTSNSGHWRLENSEVSEKAACDNEFKIGFLRSAQDIEASRGNFTFHQNDEFDADMSNSSDEITLTERRIRQRMNKKPEWKRNVKFKDSEDVTNKKQEKRELMAKEKVNFFLQNLQLSPKPSTAEALSEQDLRRSSRQKRTIQDSVKIARTKRLLRQEVENVSHREEASTSDESSHTGNLETIDRQPEERHNDSELIVRRGRARQGTDNPAATSSALQGPLSPEIRNDGNPIQNLEISINQGKNKSTINAKNTGKSSLRKKLFFEDSDEVSDSHSEHPPIRKTTTENVTSRVPSEDMFKVPSLRAPKSGRKRRKDDSTNRESDKENRSEMATMPKNQSLENELEVPQNISGANRDEGDAKGNNSPFANKPVAEDLATKRVLTDDVFKMPTVRVPKSRVKRRKDESTNRGNDKGNRSEKANVSISESQENEVDVPQNVGGAQGSNRDENGASDNRPVVEDLPTRASTRPVAEDIPTRASTKKRSHLVVTPKERPKRQRRPAQTVFREQLCFVPKTALEKELFGTSRSKVIELVMFSAGTQAVTGNSRKTVASHKNSVFVLNTSSIIHAGSTNVSNRTKTKNGDFEGNAPQTTTNDKEPVENNIQDMAVSSTNKVVNKRGRGRSAKIKQPLQDVDIPVEHPPLLEDENQAPVPAKRGRGSPPTRAIRKNPKKGSQSRKNDEVQVPEPPPTKKSRSHKAQPSSESGIEVLTDINVMTDENNLEVDRFQEDCDTGTSSRTKEIISSQGEENLGTRRSHLDSPYVGSEANRIRFVASPACRSADVQLHERPGDSGFDTYNSNSLLPSSNNHKLPRENKRFLRSPSLNAASGTDYRYRESEQQGTSRGSVAADIDISQLNPSDWSDFAVRRSLLNNVTVGDEVTFKYDGQLLTYKWRISAEDSDYKLINKTAVLRCFKTIDGAASSGFLKIPVGCKKPLEISHHYHVVYVVLEGVAMVTLLNKKNSVHPYDTFTVPEGFPYSIENISDIMLHLHYTRTKKRETVL